MAEWLKAQGVSHVALESTGVFWKPVYNLLEGHFQLLLVNAQHWKQVPGRLRGKIPELEEALEGQLTEHHRYLLKILLDQLRSLEQLLGQLDHRIGELARPFQEPIGGMKCTGLSDGWRRPC